MKKDIIKHDFKSDLQQEIEIVDLATLYHEHKDILTSIHRTEFYHIIWFQKGSPSHIVDFNPIKITPNTILFLNKDTVHKFDSETTYEGKAILFTDRFFCNTENDVKFLKDNILFNDLFSVSQIQAQKQFKLFENLFQQLADELQNIKDQFQATI